MLIGVLCVVVVGRLWIICCFIVKGLISCGALFWGFVGLTKNSFRYSPWLVELAGEALVKHMKFSFDVLNVMFMEGA